MKITGVIVLAAALLAGGCAAPSIKLISDARDPLKEYTLEGEGAEKVLVISIQGVITDTPKSGFIRVLPGKVQEVVSHLRRAEKDKDIKAVLLKINSPGGTATASDVLYSEINAFKQRTGIKIVAVMMDVAASGGYYVALAADAIYAHPTTVTGSVGVIFMRPKLTGLMEKIGVGVAVSKSGTYKDMGSPFRPATQDEEQMLQAVTDDMARRFYDAVSAHRSLSPEAMADVKTARIYVAGDARSLGLIDEIGYLPDALAAARKMAGLAPGARVVVYRRSGFPDDNIYNPLSTGASAGPPQALVSVGGSEWLPDMTPGFYYLWPASIAAE
ncbi:MAG: signal peptide peptidase SppA [Pseudomonadota bacterium]